MSSSLILQLTRSERVELWVMLPVRLCASASAFLKVCSRETTQCRR